MSNSVYVASSEGRSGKVVIALGGLSSVLAMTPKVGVFRPIVRGGAEVTIPAEQVQRGDIVVIRPGERIPADGVVTDGGGTVDQSAVTGETRNAGSGDIMAR